VASIGLGVLGWTGGRRWRAIGAALIGGFLIDADHLFDYALARRYGHARMILPLHGWEYLPLIILLDRQIGARGALFAGFACHLTLDQIWNEKRSPLAYFLLYRALRGFRADSLGPEDPARRHRWRHASPAGLVRWM